MRVPPGIISIFAILLILVATLASFGAAAGPWVVSDVDFSPGWSGLFAWMQNLLLLSRLLHATGQHALSAFASADGDLPRLSLPLPAGATVTTTGGRMVFAQMADGPIGNSGRFYRTSFILVNDSKQNATGTLSFYDNDGRPLTLTLNGVTNSSFSFTLAKGTQRRYTTSGTGDIKVGWAIMQANQPVTGTSEFEIRDSNQNVYGDVGVTESSLGTKFTIFADSIGGFDTGLALVNPSTTDSNHLLLELFDPSGAKISQENLPLRPMEHASRYLTQFFNSVPHIGEFEGTMVISSLDGMKFGGITLRLIGDLMTSVPTVLPIPETITRDRMYFPQIADGLLGNYRYTSSILLFNNTALAASGTVEFFNSNGNPMNVTIGGVNAASFPYALNPGGVVRMVTSGEGSARIGWSRVKMNQPISGGAVFQVYSNTGTLLAEVGVASAAISTRFNVIADSIGAFDTALAFANPSENGAPANISARLLNRSGTQVAFTNFSLESGKHTPLYMTQLFPDYNGIGEFEGRIYFEAGNPIIPLTLRSIGEKLTSVPVLRLTSGFAPESVIEPVQNLAGTKPALRWRISQPIGDLAINSIKVLAPAFGLSPGNLKIGDTLGYGTFLLDADGNQSGGVMKLVVTDLTGGVSFQVAGDGIMLPLSQVGILQMSGKISGSPTGGLSIEMSSGDLSPRSTNGGLGIALDFFLLPDVIVAPASAGTFDIRSVYESASHKKEELDAPMRVEIVQPVTFVAPDAAKANLATLTPMFPGPKDRIRLQGTNLGSQPRIFFTPAGETEFEWPVFSVDATGIDVEMPPVLGEGVIRVDNGQGPGNPCYFRSVFAPALDLQPLATGDSVPLSFTLTTGSGQLVISGFTVSLLNADCALSGFTANAIVGTITLTGGSRTTFADSYAIRVISSAADKLVLDVSVNRSQTLTLQKIQGGVTFTYAFVNPFPAPSVYAVPLTITINLTGVPISTAVGGQTSTWSAELRSAASGFAGPNYFATVIFP